MSPHDTSHQASPNRSLNHSLKAAPNSRTTLNRRAFLKASAIAGGGMMLSFNWSCATPSDNTGAAHQSHELNAYLKINSDGTTTILVPIPEFGQNLRTSMPMIVAEELDVVWESVRVEQAPFNTDLYDRQMAGGSRSIWMNWQSLRQAGAAGRQMLMQAAAEQWQLPLDELSTDKGAVIHSASGKRANYAELAAAAAALPIPQRVSLKSVEDFSLIGSSRKNVEGLQIVTGQPMFGMDYQREGMLIAMVAHPPAFGLTVKSFDAKPVLAMPGIRDVFTVQTVDESVERNAFDTNAFPELVAIVGETTWQVMKAKKALSVEWQPFENRRFTLSARGQTMTVEVPEGLESSEGHQQKIDEMASKPGTVKRRDGNPEEAFKSAARVIERTYAAPFLAHNTMEPMNFFADVTADRVEVKGPLQAPELIEQTLSARLGVPLDKIDIEMIRMGGGFGRRAYSHYAVEAALISQQVKAPVKLVYTREDDMTNGIYRPRYQSTYRAALDADNQLIAYHLKGGGVPESPLLWTYDRFPAGAVDHCLVEDWSVPSNITTGAFRAPASNFCAAAEQSFLDEVAEAVGQDPIEYRLQLLQRVINNPVGERNDYDPARYAGVLELVRDKSGWGQIQQPGVYRGVAAYFCHNTYVAHVVDVVLENDKPVVHKVWSAVDCGIVVNRDAAINMVEGAVVDGIGNALFGAMTFSEGRPDKNNFNNYRMIRHSEAPKAIEVHFVDNKIDPTGLGEPPFPPVFAALANALYQAQGKRYYQQPFFGA